MAVYLGFDSSTQSLSAIAIEVDGSRREVVFSRSMVFDEALPEYGTRHGILPSDDPRAAVTVPALWADALDRMMAGIAADAPFPLSHLAAISGPAQQHGSVDLNARATAALGALDQSVPLAAQIPPLLARDVAPIWLDASTASQCKAIAAAVGGATAMARLTGSHACERFAGPQIRKWFEQSPDGYARTDRVHLVSSFLASLLAGRQAPVDRGDASGMNLMDLARGAWAPAALDATAPGLASKLPPIARSSAVAGTLAPYWTRRYGLPAAKVIVWSGDNACSLIGTALMSDRCLGISLGTSDTVFGAMQEPALDPSGCGHVFASAAGGYMGLTCFSNGSLTREAVRDRFGLDWHAFSALLHSSPAGNRGGLLLPWFVPEITPPVLSPACTAGIDPADPAANVRGVVEAQMMAMATHSRWIQDAPRRIHATGGAAANGEILRIMADVFDADVLRFEAGNAACLGAALRAWHASALAEGRPTGWDEIVDSFVRPQGAPIAPVEEHAAIYADLRQRYAAFEASVLERWRWRPS